VACEAGGTCPQLDNQEAQDLAPGKDSALTADEVLLAPASSTSDLQDMYSSYDVIPPSPPRRPPNLPQLQIPDTATKIQVRALRGSEGSACGARHSNALLAVGDAR
jgi:hypothetical protein